jgi:hypothetical protein
MWAFVAQTALATLATAALVFVYRWIRSRAPLAAFLFAAGLVARIAVGAGLALSWLGSTPPGAAFTPDTRWFPDAQMYYEVASSAADVGLAEISDSQASPTFVRSLAVWMRVAGPSHGAAHLLNLLVYAAVSLGICLALTRRRDALGTRATALVVGVFALSPNLIILASQPLKDTLFFGALALVVIGLWWVLPDTPGAPVRLTPVPLALVLLGIYLMSGMRAYFGLMILGLLGGVLFLRGVALIREQRRMPWRYVGAVVVVLAVVWTGCRVGGGPYYQSLVEPIMLPVMAKVDNALDAVGNTFGRSAAARPPRTAGNAGLLGVVERSRRGFEASGGGTNMATSELDRSGREGLIGKVNGVLLGLGAVFVPVSLLRATGLVHFTGGGRMLLLTDVDTVFLDLTIAACLVLVWRHRREIGGTWTLAAFLLVLGVVSALLVGYVVTNYGTLFRLRLLAVVPFWLLPLVLARSAAPTAARV